ncbi:MAG: chitobiase/beta-hexosaminidase C-terminal domain-containing protein [Prevotella sp.]|nr:chitobiase/beta-hexosaminidase C-terminal domain-containing protein [Prevotella sp.]
MIVKTANHNGGTSYNIVPKALKNLRNQARISMHTGGSHLSCGNSRNNANAQWMFVSTIFLFAPPVITKDEETSTITITAEAGATIRYAGYDVPSDEPELTPSSGGSVYSAPFTSTHLYYKAIAYRCTDESDVSDPTIFGRTASPVITYDYSTELVTIECATAGATIYYTTNGDTPTTASTQYTAPFTLSRDNPVVIKAIAVFHNEESDVAIFNQMPILVVSSDDITDMTAYYLLSPSFTASEPIGSEASPFMGTIDGDFNDITLSCPLVAYAEDATIKNVVVASATVSGSGNIGALVCEAAGTTHIYNCGVLSPYDASTQQFTSTSTVSSSNAAAGGLVGHIAEGSQVRVVNCYSYANVSGSTHAAGIVGNNEGTVGLVRIANCMMYGKLTGGTVKSPVYAGNHISNVQNYSEYNYWRYRAYTTDETPYTAYNDQLAIADDRWLTRFPFYRHIQNTHRELAAFFLFGNPARPQAPSADKVAEIGHWVLKPNVAPYPIIEEWKTNTAKTTVDINANLPNTKARYAGKKLDDITGDMVYRGDGTQVTSMGSGGMLTVNYTINDGTTNISGSVSLPITDMDTLRYDYTWGKVVLPFANEFSDWRDRANPDYSKVITGWKITSVTGGTAGALDANYNFADRDCTAKDIYHATNNPYVFAQGGNYIVPYGVTSISVEANFAKAFYLSDGRADFGYDASYKNQVNLGWSVSPSYHGQTVYTSLVSLVSVLSEASNPNQQAIVLVGNYHYNQGTIGGTVFATNKAVTIMSVDDDNNQEPDYGWYSFHSNANRSKVAPMRFDFVPNIGMGMATRVTGSTPNPSIGIWHLLGWFETTETALCHMNECEINSGVFNADDNGHGNNRWVINSGFFKQIIRGFEKADNKLSYVQIGGNAYVEQYYPSDHITKNLVTKLRPTIVTGGEIEDCFMTGNHGSAEGSNIQFWCAGGKIHKYLSAFTTNPTTANVNVTAKVDHALISRFFGGGTSASARITGNINVTMNNSKVDFYCGGPEFGDMSSGKAVTTTAKGTTFGEYYGAGFGGTSLTTIYKVEQSDFAFPSAISEFPITWNNYLYLTTNASNGLGVGYTFDYILYAGGTGTGVARFYNKFARFSLATTGNVTNTLLGCTVLGDFYGAGCQGKVSGTVTTTLTDCAVNGNAYGGGYKATNNKLNVYPNTQPAYSSYYKEMGLFSDFGTVTPEEWEWVQGALDGKDEANHKLTTNVDLTTLGNVTGAISLTIDGDSEIGTPGDPATGNVFGGGNESRSLSNATVRLQGNTLVRGNVYGGGNKADVEGSSKVEIPAAPSGSGD